MEENGRLLERVNFHFLFSNFRFLFLFLMPNCFPERDGDLGVYNGCIFCWINLILVCRARSGGTALDICCGSGDLTFLLSEKVGLSGKVNSFFLPYFFCNFLSWICATWKAVPVMVLPSRRSRLGLCKGFPLSLFYHFFSYFDFTFGSMSWTPFGGYGVRRRITGPTWRSIEWHAMRFCSTSDHALKSIYLIVSWIF